MLESFFSLWTTVCVYFGWLYMVFFCSLEKLTMFQPLHIFFFIFVNLFTSSLFPRLAEIILNSSGKVVYSWGVLLLLFSEFTPRIIPVNLWKLATFWLDFEVLWFSMFLFFANYNPGASCTRLPSHLNLTKYRTDNSNLFQTEIECCQ